MNNDNAILKMEGVEIKQFPPGPMPTPRNFEWIGDDDELEFYLLFGEGELKRNALDTGEGV